MKKLITLSFCFIAAIAFSQTGSKSPANPKTPATKPAATASTTATKSDTSKTTANYKFDAMEHDYGTLQKGGDPYCEFKLTNTGKTPLVIQEAHGSCGCTIPEYPKEPIAPGQTVTIKVHYDTQRIGPFEKTVTVTFQGYTTPAVLRIHGKVEAPPADQPFPGPGSQPSSTGTPVNNQ